MSLSRTFAVTRLSQRSAASVSSAHQPAFRRGYASEPINQERSVSRAPFLIPVALGVLVAGYLLGTKDTPKTPAVEGIIHATHPKTPDAKAAAGAPDHPAQRSSQAGSA